MNTVNEFLLNTKNSLTSYDNNRDESYVNADRFGATEQFDDLWNAAHTELQERYSLPAFHICGSGFEQGDASNEEVFEAKDYINESDGDDEPAVFAEWDDENDEEIITDIYEYLDKEFLKILNPKVKVLIEEYESFCKSQMNENK